MRHRHMGRILAKEKAQFGMENLFERAVSVGVYDNNCGNCGKQHNKRRPRRRVREADEFAIALLMPLHLIDKQIVGH